MGTTGKSDPTSETATADVAAKQSVDVRTRRPADYQWVDFATFHESVATLPADRRALAARGIHAAGLRSVTLRAGDLAYTWRAEGDELIVEPGDPGHGALAVIDPTTFSDLVQDARSTVALMISRQVEMARGTIIHFARWETVLRGLLDGWAVHEPGAISFVDADGTPLDFGRSFTLDDDPAVMGHFLREAGFLHLRGAFSTDHVEALSGEIDRWFSQMTPESPKSWWARAAGEMQCVRVTDLVDADLRTPVFEHEAMRALAALPDDGHRPTAIDLLVKPVGVEEGISDLPWHKDCSLGMHSYNCCSMTAGISVTGSDETNGQLGVVAGSHRANIQLLELDESIDLPRIYLSTEPGDMTVHLSCTLHTSTPPKHTERRVIYASLRLPGSVRELANTSLREVRDQAGRDTFAPTTAST